MNITAGYPLLIQIGIALVVSTILGLALLKIYVDFQRAVREKSRRRLWWVFSAICFIFSLIVILFGNMD